MAEGDIALRVDGATCYFDVSPSWLTRVVERSPKRTLRAVDGVSFEVPRGKTLSVVGESGCGKSTLARMAVGLQVPTAGTLAFTPIEKPDGTSAPPRLQMIFQDPYASLNPRWRVGDIVSEPIRELGLMEGETAIQGRIGELLGIVGLSPSDASRYPHEFSGGQRQRISSARALATEADFLVCDEPTSALDVSVQAQILNLMRRLQDQFGLTYLFISHNLSVVRHMSDQIAIMYLGRIVEIAPMAQLYGAPGHPYTRALFDSVPRVGAGRQVFHPIAGEIPSPINPPSGCHFHPRCPLAGARCKREAPALQTNADGRQLACHLAAGGVA